MHKQAHTTLVNGVETSALSIADRGLAYGDGLFETMRVTRHSVPLLSFHIERFARGVERLSLGPKKTLCKGFKEALNEAMAAVSGDALIKVIATRGVGGRGYVPPTHADVTFIAQVFDEVERPAFSLSGGMNVIECQCRLAHQPLLAGIKHLNRLEQILLSRELKGHSEGLVFDYDNQLVEGTKSNILVFEEDRVVTPRLDRCGVQGTLRDFLLVSGDELGFNIEEDSISRSRYESAEALAAVSGVMGIRAIKSVQRAGVKHNYNSDSRMMDIHSLLKRKLFY